MTRSRVIGLGQPVAGDDGVGHAVLRELRGRGLESYVELLEVADAIAFVPLLGHEASAVLVDAVIGVPAGEIIELTAEDLAARAPLRLSSHGLGVSEAIELARILNDGRGPPVLRIVAVGIDRPERYEAGLSPEVAAAVSRAADLVISLLEACRP